MFKGIVSQKMTPLAQLDFSMNLNKLIFWGAEYESIKKSGI